MVSRSGSSRTPGDPAGVMRDTSRWSWGRICVVSYIRLHKTVLVSVESNLFLHYVFVYIFDELLGLVSGIATCAAYPVVA